MMTKFKRLRNVITIKIRKQPKLRRWLIITQLVTQKDDHGDHQEHKRTTITMAMAKRNTTRNTRK